jgi:hypothetical protein
VTKDNTQEQQQQQQQQQQQPQEKLFSNRLFAAAVMCEEIDSWLKVKSTKL